MSSKSYNELIKRCKKMNKQEYFSVVVNHYNHINSKRDCILCELGEIKRKNFNIHDMYIYFD